VAFFGSGIGGERSADLHRRHGRSVPASDLEAVQPAGFFRGNPITGRLSDFFGKVIPTVGDNES